MAVLNYGSVCSGIGCDSLAWRALPWRCSFFSEIEKFPRAVLQSRFPGVPLHGDFTTIARGEYEPIDLLVGGTPCQSFSLAGLRGGMADSRGNLALEFIKLARRLGPRWLVWENVAGVLSSAAHSAPDICPPDVPMASAQPFSEMETSDHYNAEELHALNCLLAGLSEVGYGFAYRVFDAQYAGVPQRRRRIFLVGYLGDWRPPAAVLFEPESLRGHSSPRGAAGKNIAGALSARARGGGGLGTDFECQGGLQVASATGDFADYQLGNPTLKSRGGDSGHGSESLVWGGNNCGGPIDVAPAVNAHPSGARRMDFETEALVTHTLRGEGFDASEDGTGRGTPLVAVPILEVGKGSASRGEGPNDMGIGADGDPMFTVQRGAQHAVAFSCKDHGADLGPMAPTLRAMGYENSHQNAGGQVAVAQGVAVRRLTVVECERLQGLPDNWTAIDWRRRKIPEDEARYYVGHGLEVWREGGQWFTRVAPDGPRYQAIGNGMALPDIRWIGERIAKVQKILNGISEGRI